MPATTALNKTRCNITKTISCLTLGFFLSTHLSWAGEPLPFPAARNPASPISIPDHLEIPQEFGSIQEEYQSGGHSPLIIFIQDAHMVLDAQSNIQNLIQHLQDAYGISVIALEGGRGALDPTLFRTFPDEGAKKKVLSGYWEKGELTGAEMASIFNPKEGKYSGIEDWKLYEENYLAYLRAGQKREKILEELAWLKSELDTKRKAVYTEELNEFHEKVEAFREERAHLLELLQYLRKKTATRFGEQLLGPEAAKRYPHLWVLYASIEKDAAMNTEELEAAIRELGDGFKKKHGRSMTKTAIMAFNSKYQDFVTGRSDAASFLKVLIKVSGEMKDPVKLTGGMEELLGHTETLSSIKGTKLFDELEALMLEIENQMIKTGEEREISEKYKKLRLLKNLAMLELTRDDLETYRKDSGSYRGLVPVPQRLDPAEEFYRLAVERDRALQKNLLELMKREKAASAVVLAGGFHSQGFARGLKEQGCSYVMVTPRINSLRGHELYDEVMKGKLSYKDYLETTFYDAFVRAATVKMVAELDEPDFRKALKQWRDEVIRKLAEEGRVARSGDYTKYIDFLLKLYVEKYGTKNLTSKTKGEILKSLEKTIKKAQKKKLSGLWKDFEFQLDQFVKGVNSTSNLQTLRGPLASKSEVPQFFKDMVLGKLDMSLLDAVDFGVSQADIRFELERIRGKAPVESNLGGLNEVSNAAAVLGKIGKPKGSIDSPRVAEAVVRQLIDAVKPEAERQMKEQLSDPETVDAKIADALLKKMETPAADDLVRRRDAPNDSSDMVKADKVRPAMAASMGSEPTGAELLSAMSLEKFEELSIPLLSHLGVSVKARTGKPLGRDSHLISFLSHIGRPFLWGQPDTSYEFHVDFFDERYSDENEAAASGKGEHHILELYFVYKNAAFGFQLLEPTNSGLAKEDPLIKEHLSEIRRLVKELIKMLQLKYPGLNIGFEDDTVFYDEDEGGAAADQTPATPEQVETRSVAFPTAIMKPAAVLSLPSPTPDEKGALERKQFKEIQDFLNPYQGQSENFLPTQHIWELTEFPGILPMAWLIDLPFEVGVLHLKDGRWILVTGTRGEIDYLTSPILRRMFEGEEVVADMHTHPHVHDNLGVPPQYPSLGDIHFDLNFNPRHSLHLSSHGVTFRSMIYDSGKWLVDRWGANFYAQWLYERNIASLGPGENTNNIDRINLSELRRIMDYSDSGSSNHQAITMYPHFLHEMGVLKDGEDILPWDQPDKIKERFAAMINQAPVEGQSIGTETEVTLTEPTAAALADSAPASLPPTPLAPGTVGGASLGMIDAVKVYAMTHFPTQYAWLEEKGAISKPRLDFRLEAKESSARLVNPIENPREIGLFYEQISREMRSDLGRPLSKSEILELVQRKIGEFGGGPEMLKSLLIRMGGEVHLQDPQSFDSLYNFFYRSALSLRDTMKQVSIRPGEKAVVLGSDAEKLKLAYDLTHDNEAGYFYLSRVRMMSPSDARTLLMTANSVIGPSQYTDIMRETSTARRRFQHHDNSLLNSVLFQMIKRAQTEAVNTHANFEDIFLRKLASEFDGKELQEERLQRGNLTLFGKRHAFVDSMIKQGIESGAFLKGAVDIFEDFYETHLKAQDKAVIVDVGVTGTQPWLLYGTLKYLERLQESSPNFQTLTVSQQTMVRDLQKRKKDIRIVLFSGRWEDEWGSIPHGETLQGFRVPFDLSDLVETYQSVQVGENQLIAGENLIPQPVDPWLQVMAYLTSLIMRNAFIEKAQSSVPQENFLMRLIRMLWRDVAWDPRMISKERAEKRAAESRRLHKDKLDQALQRNYAAVLMDIDGTLRDGGREVPVDVLDNIIRLLEEGSRAAVGTGKADYGVEQILITPLKARMEVWIKALEPEITAEQLAERIAGYLGNLDIFAFNGALAYNAGTGAIYYEEAFPGDSGIPVDRRIQAQIDRIRKEKTLGRDILSVYEGSKYSFYLELKPGSDYNKYVRKLNTFFEKQGIPLHAKTSGTLVDIFPKGVDKGRAARDLAMRLDVSPSRIAKIGDQLQKGGNDDSFDDESSFSVGNYDARNPRQISLSLAMGKSGSEAASYLLNRLNIVAPLELSSVQVSAASLGMNDVADLLRPWVEKKRKQDGVLNFKDQEKVDSWVAQAAVILNVVASPRDRKQAWDQLQSMSDEERAGKGIPKTYEAFEREIARAVRLTQEAAGSFDLRRSLIPLEGKLTAFESAEEAKQALKGALGLIVQSDSSIQEDRKARVAEAVWQDFERRMSYLTEEGKERTVLEVSKQINRGEINTAESFELTASSVRMAIDEKTFDLRLAEKELNLRHAESGLTLRALQKAEEQKAPAPVLDGLRSEIVKTRNAYAEQLKTYTEVLIAQESREKPLPNVWKVHLWKLISGPFNWLGELLLVLGLGWLMSWYENKTALKVLRHQLFFGASDWLREFRRDLERRRGLVANPIRTFYGNLKPQDWKTVIDLALEAGPSAPHLIQHALPALQRILTPQNIQSTMQDLMRIDRQGWEGSNGFIYKSVANLIKEFGIDWVRPRWADLVRMGLAGGNQGALIFGLSHENLDSIGEKWVNAHWNDLVALSNLSDGGAWQLFNHTLPDLFKSFGPKWLENNWQKLMALGLASNGRAAENLSSLKYLHEAFGTNWIQEHWSLLGSLAARSGRDAYEVFTHGLPLFKEMVTAQNVQKISDDLMALSKAADLDAWNVFFGTLPALKETLGMNWIEQNWDAFQARLLSLMENTAELNRRNFLWLLLNKDYIAFLKTGGADFLNHLAFYESLILQERQNAYPVLEGVVEGVRTGIIDLNMPGEEQNLIREFIGKYHAFNPLLFAFYKRAGGAEQGDAMMQPLFDFARKIHKDEVGAKEVNEFRKHYKDQAQELGFEAPDMDLEILFAASQMAVPSSKASFARRRDTLRTLLKNAAEEIGDLRGQIPPVLRDPEDSKKSRDFGDQSPIVLRGLMVKPGETIDRGELSSLRDAFRPEGGKGAEPAAKSAFQRSLSDYLKNRESGEKRGEALKAFLAYSGFNENLAEQLSQIDALESPQGILQLERIFAGGNVLDNALRAELEQMNPDMPQVGTEGGSPIANVSQLVKAMNGIWASPRADKQELIEARLRDVSQDDLRTKLIPNMEGRAPPELQSLIGAIAERSTRPLTHDELANELLAEARGLVENEKGKLISRQDAGEEIIPEFHVVKGIPYSLWGTNCGVCVYSDAELWKNPAFMLLSITDQTGRVRGFVHLFEVVINGKKVLTIPGINPSIEFLTQAKAEDIYPLIENALIKVAREGGYEALYLPTNQYIHSNIQDIQKIVQAKYAGREIDLPFVVEWNHKTDDAPQYPFQQVYEMWNRNGAAESLFPNGGAGTIRRTTGRPVLAEAERANLVIETARRVQDISRREVSQPEKRSLLVNELFRGASLPSAPPPRTVDGASLGEGIKDAGGDRQDWIEAITLYHKSMRTAAGKGYPAVIREFLESFFRSLEPSAAILDLGTGNLPALLLAKGISPDFDLHGVDLADIETGEIPNSEGIHFHQGSFTDMDFFKKEGKKFDAVTSVFAIEYDLEGALEELKDVVKLGARGAFTVDRPDSKLAEDARRIVRDIESLQEGIFPDLAFYFQASDWETWRARILEDWGSPDRSTLEPVFYGRIKSDEVRRDINNFLRVLKDPKSSRESIIDTLTRMEKTLKVNLKIGRSFLKNAAVYGDPEKLKAIFKEYGFEVEALDDLFDEDNRLLGWGLKIRKTNEVVSPLKAPGAASLPSSAPLTGQSLGEKVPLMRFIAFLEEADEELFQQIQQKIKSGESFGAAIRSFAVNKRFVDEETRDLIQGQFSSQERAVAELVSNAVDAYRAGSSDQPKVDVTFEGRRRFRVADKGEGMSLETILTKLLIPQATGKEGREGIGRFGIGFYSILGFLKDAGDKVIVSTGQGGEESYRVTFTYEDGDYQVSVETLSESRQGTEIEVAAASRDMNRDEIKRLLNESFEFNIGSEISLTQDGQPSRINQPEKYQRVSFGKSRFGFSAEKAGSEKGSLVVSVSGVRIFSLATSGFNLPKTFIVDLPPGTELTIARNMVKVTPELIQKIKEMLGLIASDSTLSDTQKLDILNGLYPLMRDLQKRNDSLFGEDNLENALKKHVLEIAKRESAAGKTVLPAAPLFGSLAADSGIVWIAPALYGPALADGTVLNPFESDRLKVVGNTVNVFVLDFSKLPQVMRTQSFLFDRDAGMLFLSKEFFGQLDHLKLEEVKLLLIEPVKELLGSQKDLFEEIKPDLVSPLPAGRLPERAGRAEEILQFKKILLMRELGEVLGSVFGEGYQSGDYSVPLPADERQRDLLQKDQLRAGQALIKQVLHELLPRASPEIHGLMDQVVDELTRRMVTEHWEDFSKMLPILASFYEIHRKRSREIDSYRDYFEKIALYLNSTYDDMEDDVFAALSERVTEDRVVDRLSRSIDQILRPRASLLAVYDSGNVKDQVLDAFLNVEHEVADPEIRARAMVFLHQLIRALHSLRDDQIFVRLSGLAETVRVMEPELKFFRDKAIPEDLVKQFLLARIQFLETHALQQSQDPITRADVFRNFFQSMIHRLEEPRAESFNYTEWIKHAIEFINHLSTAPLEGIRQIRNAYYDTWIVENIDFINRLIQGGQFKIVEKLVQLVRDIHANRRHMGTDLSQVEIRQNISELMNYFAAGGRTAQLSNFLNSAHNFFDNLSRQASEAEEAGTRFEPLPASKTPRVIRDYMIRIFDIKPGALAAVEREGRVDISRPSYASGTTMSRFYQNFRKNENALQQHVGFDEIPAFIQTLEQPALTERQRQTIGRRINQAIKHVSPDTYIFLREMLQNSRDAAVEHEIPEQDRDFQVSLHEETVNGEKHLYVSMGDKVGMNFDVLKNFLFVLGSSSKREREDLIGQYGTGFFTIFRDAEEVLIKTSTGDGEVIYVRMTPVFREGTKDIEDIRIEIDRVREEGFKGTLIQQVRKTDFPEMAAAAVQSRLMTYGGIMDPEEIRVKIGARQINTMRKELVTEVATRFGPIRFYYLPGENTLTQNGLYLNEIGESYERWLGEGGLELVKKNLLKTGIVIDLPPQLELIKDRSDIKDRETILTEIGPMIQTGSVNALLKLFVTRKLTLPEIPYDLFYNSGSLVVPQDILDDAFALTQGRTLEGDEVRKYLENKENVTLLILSMKLFDGLSIIDLVKGFMSGAIPEEALPTEIRAKLSKDIKEKKELEAKQKEMNIGEQFGIYGAGYQGQREEARHKQDLGLPSFNPADSNQTGFESYFALTELTNKIGELITGVPFETLFYSRPDGSGAHASRRRNGMGWNLYALSDYLKFMEEIFKAPADDSTGLYKIAETVVHEIAHVREGGTATHHAQFYEVQLDNIARFITHEKAFRVFFAEWKEKYRTRLGSQKNVKELASYLVGLASGNIPFQPEDVVPGTAGGQPTAQSLGQNESPSYLDRISFLNERVFDPEFIRMEQRISEQRVTLSVDLDQTLRGKGIGKIRPALVELLRDLKQKNNVRLVLWTAAARDSTRRFFEKNLRDYPDLAELFDRVITYENYRLRKLDGSAVTRGESEAEQAAVVAKGALPQGLTPEKFNEFERRFGWAKRPFLLGYRAHLDNDDLTNQAELLGGNLYRPVRIEEPDRNLTADQDALAADREYITTSLRPRLERALGIAQAAVSAESLPSSAPLPRTAKAESLGQSALFILTGKKNAEELAGYLEAKGLKTPADIKAELIKLAQGKLAELRGELKNNRDAFIAKLEKSENFFDALFDLEDEMADLFLPLKRVGVEITQKELAGMASEIRTAVLGFSSGSALESSRVLESKVTDTQLKEADRRLARARQSLTGQALRQKFILTLQHSGADMPLVLKRLENYRQLLKMLIIMHKKGEPVNRADSESLKVPVSTLMLKSADPQKVGEAFKQAMQRMESENQPPLFVLSKLGLPEDISKMLVSILTQIDQAPDRLKKQVIDATFILIFALAALAPEKREQALASPDGLKQLLTQSEIGFLAQGFDLGAGGRISLNLDGFITSIAQLKAEKEVTAKAA